MTDDTYSIDFSVGNLELAVSGSEEFVEEQFFKLYEDHDIKEIDLSSEGGLNGTPEAGPEQNSSSGEQSSDAKKTLDKTLNEYLANSEASTYQDNALVVGWYLEYAEGQDDFTAPEVEDKAHNDKVQLGAKVKRDLDKNVEKGYLYSPGERDGSDTYWVTDSGEDYLQDLGFPIP